MIDGAVFREESENIMAVPAVFLNGEEFGNGRMTIQDILSKLGSTADASEFENKEPYDVLIVGGGPALSLIHISEPTRRSYVSYAV
ncbi:hypothetical protein QMN62_26245, partial [Escherichia coli]|nr:hypothetical protein [Escherichia coli]